MINCYINPKKGDAGVKKVFFAALFLLAAILAAGAVVRSQSVLEEPPIPAIDYPGTHLPTAPRPEKAAAPDEDDPAIDPEKRVDRRAELIYFNHPELTPVDFESPSLLPLTEDMGEAYTSRIVFLCDSPTWWMKPFGLLTGGTNTTQIWTGPEGTVTLAYLRGYKILDPYDGALRTIPEVTRLHKPEYMIVALGMNGVAFMDEDYFKREYRNILDEMKAASPETKFILQSIYPVSRADASRGIITNADITRANAWILQLAEEYGYPYLDSFSALIAGDGYSPANLMLPDGFHPNKAGLTKILEYIRTHAVTE